VHNPNFFLTSQLTREKVLLQTFLAICSFIKHIIWFWCKKCRS